MRKKKPHMEKNILQLLNNIKNNHNSSECPFSFSSFYSLLFTDDLKREEMTQSIQGAIYKAEPGGS